MKKGKIVVYNNFLINVRNNTGIKAFKIQILSFLSIYMNPFNFRALQTMIDLGRITDKCTDCPQVIPIAGDLTMDGLKRDVYRMAYKAAQSRGAKVEFKNKFYITLILD